MTTTQRLIDQLNATKGLTYPDKGYILFADIRGDGSNRKSCYTVINCDGGLMANALNGISPRERCNALRDCIRAEGDTPCV